VNKHIVGILSIIIVIFLDHIIIKNNI